MQPLKSHYIWEQWGTPSFKSPLKQAAASKKQIWQGQTNSKLLTSYDAFRRTVFLWFMFEISAKCATTSSVRYTLAHSSCVILVAVSVRLRAWTEHLSNAVLFSLYLSSTQFHVEIVHFLIFVTSSLLASHLFTFLSVTSSFTFLVLAVLPSSSTSLCHFPSLCTIFCSSSFSLPFPSRPHSPPFFI